MEDAGLPQEQSGGGGFAGETPKLCSHTALGFPTRGGEETAVVAMGETEARQENGVSLTDPPFFPLPPQVVEDERSDREETDNSEEEEEAAKNGPLSNGHPVLNNNHRKTD